MRASVANPVNRACIWLVAALLCVSNPLGISATARDAPLLNDHLAHSMTQRDASEGPLNISSSAIDSHAPALAVGIHLVHVVWEEGDHVYHRMSHDGVWSTSRSVATGEQPDIAVDSSGMAHVVFVNEFNQNYEVYYCRWNGTSWSLPRNVSNTTGVSSAPSIAIAPGGVLHVVWADNTPSYSVIYHAYWNGTYWLNEPLPYATGGAPAITVAASGLVDVVWQDRDASDLPYEIYHSQWNGQQWSLPENLSDSASEQSVIPSVAMDQNDEAHVTWQERVGATYVIYYTYGQVGFWSIPEPISGGSTDAYLPSAVVRPALADGAQSGGSVYVGWDESTAAVYRTKNAGTGEWSPPSTLLADPLGVAEVQLAIDAGGLFHAVWSERVAVDNWDIFYQCLSRTLVLPLILKRM